jgi:CBS-domain-containing membrane protein
MFWQRAASWFGLGDDHPVSHREKLISALGGFVGVLLVFWSSKHVLDAHGTVLILASMGSSAVLLFAVPHGSLSQPWSVIGGHLISAAVGVTCAYWLDNPLIAASLAVGLAIGLMYYFGCLHPPGGATAMIAVLGGTEIHDLGYAFLLQPVLSNSIIIVAVAIITNYAFAWRRYPRAMMPAKELSAPFCPPGEKCLIAHSDLVYALSELDSYIDVSEDDLLQIYALAMRHSIEVDDHLPHLRRLEPAKP